MESRDTLDSIRELLNTLYFYKNVLNEKALIFEGALISAIMVVRCRQCVPFGVDYIPPVVLLWIFLLVTLVVFLYTAFRSEGTMLACPKEIDWTVNANFLNEGRVSALTLLVLVRLVVVGRQIAREGSDGGKGLLFASDPHPTQHRNVATPCQKRNISLTADETSEWVSEWSIAKRWRCSRTKRNFSLEGDRTGRMQRTLTRVNRWKRPISSCTVHIEIVSRGPVDREKEEGMVGGRERPPG